MLQVELACKLADDDFFRPGMAKKMTVQPAKFEMHGLEYVPKKKANKKKTTKDKQKIAEKVLGWGGFDDTVKASQVGSMHESKLLHTDVSAYALGSFSKGICVLEKLNRILASEENLDWVINLLQSAFWHDLKHF